MKQENIELRATSLRDPRRIPAFARVGAVAGLGTLAVLGTGAMCSSEASKPEPASTPQPTATREFTPTPEATATVTPSEIPPEAREILQDLRNIVTFEPVGLQEISQRFRNELKENGEEYGDYYNLYSGVWAHYTGTTDGDALELMEKIEGVILQKWPDLYKASEESGGFYRLGK